ncbi:Arc family DNA-binding protein [Acinetobacter baumannii]|uniref:Arc family DNA-binding protein n=1 Tax=Acinetobacter baumannii TaxID=470 RepID=UPI001FF4B102|nr:Arc family DNA-binding protein [Acinetobacter baumannii]MCJ9147469.1 Arc family DNA-binding protein [Acinetobacter baumannii]MDK2143719.1 Arc family DNA-binding protein [Acinetobacter baumannii]MDK2162220.1 Arc family DNA-binding protein [Acinetobacter baumannii]MDK2173371.1 Arc family DNA-binding protein [Acinetobacter baumannii]MDK2202303.1 Arc family DNA-binding protein [Acinetobacter baumannii]
MSENQKEPQYKLRWNEDLRNKVMNSAKANNRSINQEIIVRLEESFNPPMEFKSDDKEMITKIVALSMQTLLETLHDEGVEDEKLTNAVSKIANNKKAP